MTDADPSAQADPHAADADDLSLALPSSEPPPRGSVGAGLAAFATVLLVGGSVALLMTREPRYPAVEPAAPRAMTVTEATSRPVAPEVIAPAAPAAPEPAALPASMAAAPAASPAAPAPPAAPARAAVAAPRLATLNPAPPARLDRADPCASLPPAARARCLYPPLDDADARLADAFDSAVDAGVPWPLLRRYRTAWDGLRGRAERDPAAVAQTYGAMAEELEDLTARRF